MSSEDVIESKPLMQESDTDALPRTAPRSTATYRLMLLISLCINGLLLLVAAAYLYRLVNGVTLDRPAHEDSTVASYISPSDFRLTEHSYTGRTIDIVRAKDFQHGRQHRQWNCD